MNHFIQLNWLQRDQIFIPIGNLDVLKYDDESFSKITTSLFKLFCFIARKQKNFETDKWEKEYPGPEIREQLFEENPAWFKNIHVHFWKSVLEQGKGNSFSFLWNKVTDFYPIFSKTAKQWCSG